MSTLLKALKRAEQDRRQKLAEASRAPVENAPVQLTLPVDADACQDSPLSFTSTVDANEGTPVAVPMRGEKPRINPLLVPKPVAPVPPAQSHYTGVALLVGIASVVTVAANLLYRPAPPLAPVLAMAPAANFARPTLETVSIPRALLGAGAVPLQLQLDRRTERLQVPRIGAAKAPPPGQ